MKANDLSQFSFNFSGYGHYRVVYTTPSMRYMYIATISDMTVIDATKNAECAKLDDILNLRRICVNYGTKKRIY